MAFKKKNIDVKVILLLTLLAAVSQATNLDCNGKAFHCVNSTHFMICVDLGGISTTIDDVVIPCPSPTVCDVTNHFECEFPASSTPSVNNVESTAVTETDVTTATPLFTTSTVFKEYFGTVTTTTLIDSLPQVTVNYAVELINQNSNLSNSTTENTTIAVLNSDLVQSDINNMSNVHNINKNLTKNEIITVNTVDIRNISKIDNNKLHFVSDMNNNATYKDSSLNLTAGKEENANVALTNLVTLKQIHAQKENQSVINVTLFNNHSHIKINTKDNTPILPITTEIIKDNTTHLRTDIQTTKPTGQGSDDFGSKTPTFEPNFERYTTESTIAFSDITLNDNTTNLPITTENTKYNITHIFTDIQTTEPTTQGTDNFGTKTTIFRPDPEKYTTESIVALSDTLLKDNTTYSPINNTNHIFTDMHTTEPTTQSTDDYGQKATVLVSNTEKYTTESIVSFSDTSSTIEVPAINKAATFSDQKQDFTEKPNATAYFNITDIKLKVNDTMLNSLLNLGSILPETIVKAEATTTKNIENNRNTKNSTILNAEMNIMVAPRTTEDTYTTTSSYTTDMISNFLSEKLNTVRNNFTDLNNHENTTVKNIILKTITNEIPHNNNSETNYLLFSGSTNTAKSDITGIFENNDTNKTTIKSEGYLNRTFIDFVDIKDNKNTPNLNTLKQPLDIVNKYTNKSAPVTANSTAETVNRNITDVITTDILHYKTAENTINFTLSNNNSSVQNDNVVVVLFDELTNSTSQLIKTKPITMLASTINSGGNNINTNMADISTRNKTNDKGIIFNSNAPATKTILNSLFTTESRKNAHEDILMSEVTVSSSISNTTIIDIDNLMKTKTIKESDKDSDRSGKEEIKYLEKLNNAIQENTINVVQTQTLNQFEKQISTLDDPRRESLPIPITTVTPVTDQNTVRSMTTKHQIRNNIDTTILSVNITSLETSTASNSINIIQVQKVVPEPLQIISTSNITQVKENQSTPADEVNYSTSVTESQLGVMNTTESIALTKSVQSKTTTTNVIQPLLQAQESNYTMPFLENLGILSNESTTAPVVDIFKMTAYYDHQNKTESKDLVITFSDTSSTLTVDKKFDESTDITQPHKSNDTYLFNSAVHKSIVPIISLLKETEIIDNKTKENVHYIPVDIFQNNITETSDSEYVKNVPIALARDTTFNTTSSNNTDNHISSTLQSLVASDTRKSNSTSVGVIDIVTTPSPINETYIQKGNVLTGTTSRNTNELIDSKLGALQEEVISTTTEENVFGKIITNQVERTTLNSYAQSETLTASDVLNLTDSKPPEKVGVRINPAIQSTIALNESDTLGNISANNFITENIKKSVLNFTINKINATAAYLNSTFFHNNDIKTPSERIVTSILLGSNNVTSKTAVEENIRNQSLSNVYEKNIIKDFTNNTAAIRNNFTTGNEGSSNSTYLPNSTLSNYRISMSASFNTVPNHAMTIDSVTETNKITNNKNDTDHIVSPPLVAPKSVYLNNYNLVVKPKLQHTETVSVFIPHSYVAPGSRNIMEIIQNETDRVPLTDKQELYPPTTSITPPKSTIEHAKFGSDSINSLHNIIDSQIETNINNNSKKNMHSEIAEVYTTTTLKVTYKNGKDKQLFVRSSAFNNTADTVIISGNKNVNNNNVSKKTHSDILSAILTPPKERFEKQGNAVKDQIPVINETLEKQEKDKDEAKLTNMELASLQETNNNNIVKDITTVEKPFINFTTVSDEAFIKPMYNNIIFKNSTSIYVSEYTEKTPTHRPFQNNTSKNYTLTFNGKSQDLNAGNPRARNMTVITDEQSDTPDNSTKTASTITADKQITKRPTLESSTQKIETNKFSCVNKRGRYSDDKDCRKFYICVGNAETIERMCPVNTVFSEINKQCTKNLSHCIRNNQFRCVTEGRFGDFLNDNVYYICVKNNVHFIRFKLQCQNGYRLNKTSVRCELNTELTSSDSKSVSEQSLSSSKLVVKQNNKPKFKCEEEGIFPDPSNCRKYYVCTVTNSSEFRQKLKKCDSDEVFHTVKKICVDAESYEC